MDLQILMITFCIVTCPDGLVAVLGKCYKFSEDKKTWSDAQIECQSIQPGSYDLVVIDSEELNEYLKQYPDHWIGLNDMFREGELTWVNGQPAKIEETFSQSPWRAGEPNVHISFYIYRFLELF